MSARPWAAHATRSRPAPEPARRRSLAATLAAAALVLGSALPAAAHDDDDRGRTLRNAARVELTHDGASRSRTAWAVRQTTGPDVSAANLALAAANCDGCTAVAVAFQVVVAGRVTGTVTPSNLALAVNDGCEHCNATAIAYQFVVLSDEGLWLTRDARRELSQIRRELRRLVRSGATAQELDAQAAALAERVRAVLADGTTSRRHQNVKVQRGSDRWDGDDHKGSGSQHDGRKPARD
jgi:putative peptide zinc metalloprotease protein